MIKYEKIDLALLDPVYAYFIDEWDEAETHHICCADALGYDMIYIDSLIKAMGRRHEIDTIFNIRNIASVLLELDR